jgi:hypothetical protein
VSQLQTVHSAEQLDAVLVTLDMRTVLPAAGGDADLPATSADALAHQRKLLKRTIEQVLSQEDVSASMNAKVRRRVTRITSALAEEDGASAEAAAPAGASESNSADKGASQKSGLVIPPVVDANARKVVPHVVFVGNLSYDTTAAELEAHLRQSAALEGTLKVRMRSHAETGQSLGVAFVDLEGPRELHQCIGMAHHTTLRGRIINVEKSCGGRNKAQRGEKIASKRSEQQSRAEEAVNQVLVKYEQKGVLRDVHKWGPTLKESVYAHCPQSLTEVSMHVCVVPQSLYVFVLGSWLPVHWAVRFSGLLQNRHLPYS